jgi:hypothetical protein
MSTATHREREAAVWLALYHAALRECPMATDHANRARATEAAGKTADFALLEFKHRYGEVIK